MPGVGSKKYPYTVSGLQRAEAEAVRTGNPVKSDQSVYGPSNAIKQRTTKRRKAPRPYKTNRNL